MEDWTSLWEHLRTSVLPHRVARLGPAVSFRLLASNMTTEFVLRKDFILKGMPSGAVYQDSWVNKYQTVINAFAACNVPEALLANAWRSLKPGVSILAVPVCSERSYDRAFDLLYMVHCTQMTSGGGDTCPNPISGTRNPWGGSRVPATKLGCKDFPLQGVSRVGFLPGFFLLEKGDRATSAALGRGEFLTMALGIQPVTTDKVTSHQYNEIYERYLPRLRQDRTAMLEIGLGCTMGYGPGKSAELWVKYFPHMRIQFLESDRECVQKWRKEMTELNLTIHVGDQKNKQVNLDIVAKSPPGGFKIIVDDGDHSNRALKLSFDVLWSALARDGYFFVEDMASPAFKYLDCEPLLSTKQRQQGTMLAKLVQTMKSTVLRLPSEIARMECQVEICVLHKKA